MPEWLILILTVPTITGVIGWVTNFAAVKMIFWPTTFVGLGPVGWQGILYKQGDKFGLGVADMVSENLMTSEELASKFKIKDIEEILVTHLDPDVPGACAELATEFVGQGAWEKLPENVQTMIATQVRTQTRVIAGEVLETLQHRAPEFMDIHGIVYKQLTGPNVGRLARLTQKIGKREFKFIEYYGGIFGLMIGCAQIVVWQAMQTWWLMPVVGVGVGLLTNWLAIQMIFRPQEPTRYFGLITYQGLFAKRQKDIARDYAETAEAEILTPDTLINALLNGKTSARLAQEITEMVTTRIQTELGKYKAMLPIEITPKMIERAQELITARVLRNAPRAMPDIKAYLADRMDVRNTVEDRLGNMPKSDFERVLRGIFEEDETTLIIVGGVLGGSVGLLQGLLVTSL